MAYVSLARALAGAIALLAPVNVQAGTAQDEPAVGSTYEIKRTYSISETSSDGSSSGGNGNTAIVERVVVLRENGVELEYDYPSDVSAEDRAREWQLPARVLRPANGPMQLLNSRELEARVDSWLKRAKLPREACGSWYFTWNAFQIECDPQAVLKTIAAYDLGPTALRSATMYSDPSAIRPAPLVRGSGATYVARLAPDPDAVKRVRAEMDVVAAQINREKLSFESALQARSVEQVSGEITVTFNADALGRPYRKTTVTKLRIKNKDGVTEDSTGTVIVERRNLQ